MAKLNSTPIFVTVLCLCLTYYAGVDAIRDYYECGAGPSDIESYINSSLVVPAGNSVQQALLGVGYQIYTYNGTSWVLTNVSADLFNFRGDKVGYHFFLTEPDSGGGQVTWEVFNPFSRVTARNLVTVPQTDAIAWLLNIATSNSGSGFLALTTYVQRLYTSGGQAPAADVPATAGDVFESAYSAYYVFSASNC